jgi:tetratricopeptide (TPR) repeat protein
VISSTARVERIQLGILGIYRRICAEVEAEHGRLFSTADRQSLSTLTRWFEAWAVAFHQRKAVQVPAEDLVKNGRLLARVAESYTAHEIAERVFRGLETLSKERDPNGLGTAEILADIGELDRRLAQLDRATERCNRALDIARVQGTPAAHKLVSRILYELAYIGLYTGDTCSALQRLEQSRVEADEAGDSVGAGIARALSAAIRSEEGVFDEPIEALQAESKHFAMLAESEELKRTGRHVFANRWRVNCDIHHVQALLVSGEIGAARQAYDDCVANDPNPSALGNATLALTGACVALAEGHLDEAAKLAERCRNATPVPFENQEAAATIASVYGVISLARGDVWRARDAFNEATRLNPALRNAKGQGWAALGLAVLAIEAGDRTAALAALDVGITRCARCCAPVRHALTELHAELAASAPRSKRNWKAVVQALTGPLPKWLAAR